MQVYVAATFGRKDLACRMMALVRSAGHTVTYDWTKHEEDAAPKSRGDQENYLRECAEADMGGVYQCDAIVAVPTGESCGTLWECGAGAARGKKIVVVIGHGARRCIFEHLRNVFVVQTMEDAIRMLKAIEISSQQREGREL